METIRAPAGAQRKDGMCKIGTPDSGRKTRYRHGLPTHDNKNPMFCIITYSPSKKLSLVQKFNMQEFSWPKFMDFLPIRTKGVA